MKWTEKKKRNLTVAGGIVLGVILVAAIAMQFGKTPVTGDKMPKESQTDVELVIDPGKTESGMESIEEPDETKRDVVIQPDTGEGTAGTETERPVDSRPAQTDQTEQSIQPEATKPAAPSEEVLKDPTQKPDGTVVDTPPEPVDHEQVETPAQTEPAPGEPQAGDTKDGQIYVPGFGWVENHGGGGSGTTAEDMYENGNKIGSMD